MNYHLKTRPKKNPIIRRAIIVVVIVVLSLGLLFVLNSRAPFLLLANVGKPFWKIGQSASAFLSSNDGFLKSKKTLVEENNSLKEALADLTIASLERDVLKKENEELKKIRDESEEPARVLSSPAHVLYDLLIVELLPDSNAKEGDLVFAEGTVLLGKILDKSGSIARVSLFSSPGTETPMRLVENGTELTLSGRGGGNFSVTVPSSLSIKEGDLFSFPSITTNIVSRVGSVIPAQIDSFNNVLSSYPVNIFEISWVGIRHE